MHWIKQPAFVVSIQSSFNGLRWGVLIFIFFVVASAATGASPDGDELVYVRALYEQGNHSSLVDYVQDLNQDDVDRDDLASIYFLAAHAAKKISEQSIDAKEIRDSLVLARRFTMICLLAANEEKLRLECIFLIGVVEEKLGDPLAAHDAYYSAIMLHPSEPRSKRLGARIHLSPEPDNNH